MTIAQELSPGDWSVLALLCERPAHGWALAEALAPEGEIGAVWALGRPVVYRALQTLRGRRLIERQGREPGTRGPSRAIFAPTDAGRAAVGDWLARPAPHVRDIRSLLVLKLVFSERAGIDPRPMLAGQRRLLEPLVASLEQQLAASDGGRRILLRYRLETARAALRFVEASA
ncbi:MAG TPA: PadR family transcriptional regulator [Gaiellaceae bacterium]|nr:PadR family transcriptional regulator [Gaiellaceae bacterium]